MKPLAVMLGAACTARILWWLPAWVTLALAAALGLAVVGERYWLRWRLAHPRPMPEVSAEDMGAWKECGVRRPLADGCFLVCVQRAGHDGDHVADRSSVSWATT